MWGLKAPGPVPHEVPMFPIVCQDKPQIVHFQLSECTDYIDTVTLVAIDMRDRAVVSVFTHIKGEQELHGEDAHVAGARTRLPQPFLPATFSKLLMSGPVNLRYSISCFCFKHDVFTLPCLFFICIYSMKMKLVSVISLPITFFYDILIK